ncbi:MAG: tetratricopeptide repeat protein [Myxococcaceae bacterium]
MSERKAPSRVPVHHFPKKGRVRRSTRDSLARTEIIQLPAERPSKERTKVARKDTEPTLGVEMPTQPRRSSGGKKRKITGSFKLTPERIEDIALLGHRLFEEKRLDEAREVFEGLVAMGVEDAFPHTMLGTVYLAKGDASRALALFEAALTLDPADLAARVYRGEIRLTRGKVKLAIDDLQKAIDQGAPDDPFVDRARRLLKLAAKR